MNQPIYSTYSHRKEEISHSMKGIFTEENDLKREGKSDGKSNF